MGKKAARGTRDRGSAAEGLAVPSRPQSLSEPSIQITNPKVHQPFKLCHPDWSDLSRRAVEAEGRDLQFPLGRNHSQNSPSK